MGFKIVEDRPTPPEVYNYRMYLFAAVASAGAMAFGYDGAFFGTTYARASFKKDFGISSMPKAKQTSTSANLTSSYLAAAFFGAAAAWPCMEYLGRRWGLRIGSIIFLVGAAIMTAAQSNINYICTSLRTRDTRSVADANADAGRVLTGFGAGSATAIIPTYVAESSRKSGLHQTRGRRYTRISNHCLSVTAPAIRGVLTGCFEISYQTGSLVGFWVSPTTPAKMFADLVQINYGINQHINLKSSTTWRKWISLA